VSVSYAELSRRINAHLLSQGEWAGVPMPLPGLGVVMEPKHPFADRMPELQAIVDSDRPKAPTTDDVEGWRIVNQWRGRVRDVTGTVYIMRDRDGRVQWGIDADAPRRNRFVLGPLETLDAWHLDTELTAIDRLATLLTPRMFHAYVITGSFLERSSRSGLTYLFRRLRPTIVLTPHGSRRGYFKGDDEASHEMHILCALCLHPIAYYGETFCGAMCPTDDVIAHLLLMRGDEAMLWRRANQHKPGAPESGL
jgi:hypothetical protein